MRIAAGVLLIIASLFTGCGGLTWAGLGGAASVAGKAVEEGSATDENGNKIELSEEGKKAAAEVSSAGSGLFALGLFLLVMFGLQIAGAVQLFRNKGANFILIVGVLTIVAEVWNIVAIKFGVGNLPALVAAILAIVAAMGMKKAAPAS